MKPGVTPFALEPLSVIDDADPAVLELLSVDHESDLVALIELYPFVPGVVPQVEWMIAGPTSVDEGDTATYTVSYGGAELGGVTATITVATATGPGSGTATSGADYTALSTVLSFTAGGATEKTVAVSTIEDTVFEGVEDFRVTLGGQSTGELVNPSVTTQLLDDESITWNVAGSTTVAESASGTYTVSYTGGTLAPGLTATVTVASAPGALTWPDATGGADYTILSTVLSFTGGGVTQKTVALSTIQDTVLEGTEDFRVTIGGASAGSIGTSQVNAILTDDDASNMNWSVAGATQVNEGSAGSYTVSYTGVTLAPGQTASITVATATGALTWPDATSGSDFTALSTVLSFTGGGATQKTVAVSTIQDTVIEGTEDFRVTIAGQSAGSLTASQVNTIVVDDDASNMNWSIAGATSVAEGSTGNYTVSYTGVTLASGQTATIVVASATGGNTNFTDASSGTDFTALSTTLTFTGGGVTQKTVAVSTIQDTAVEGTEDFRVTIGSQSAGSLATSQAVTLITDDDGAGVTSLTFIGYGTAATASIPIHASAVAGDIAIMFSEASGGVTPSDFTPSGWVAGPMISGSGLRTKIMAGILSSADITAGTVTGLTGGTTSMGIMAIVRPNNPASALTFSGLNQPGYTNADPSSQNIAASGGTPPLIPVAGWRSSGAVSPRSWSGSTPTECDAGDTRHWLLLSLFDSSPADITVDMEDEGNNNGLISGYLAVA